MKNTKKTTQEITPFDKTAVYRSAIAPLVKDLVKACAIHDVPLYLCAAVKNTDEKTEYVQDGVSAITSGLVLSDDWFPKMVNVSLGFDTVLRSESKYYHSVGDDKDDSVPSDAFLDTSFAEEEE